MSYDLSVNYEKRKNVRVEFNPVKALKKRQPLFENLPMKNEIWDITLPRMRKESDTVLLQKGDNEDCAPYLVIKVNGQRIFCKGGNWGMDDGMKRCSRERLEPYIRLHRDEHFTMIRNWTGESTEEALYDLCDEYGLLIWNELWATTEYSNVDPWDNQLFMNNARDVVKRFRNHPSIAVWQHEMKVSRLLHLRTVCVGCLHKKTLQGITIQIHVILICDQAVLGVIIATNGYSLLNLHRALIPNMEHPRCLLPKLCVSSFLPKTCA